MFPMREVTVRIYGPLNDFLPTSERQVGFAVRFAGPRSVKDLVEGLGVPHPEIDLLLVNGQSVSFDHMVADMDRIAVFPRFASLDIADVTRVRACRLATVRFVVDGHLAKLARRLRLVGLDAVCPAGAHDDQLATLAFREQRILLTRDRELLKRRVVAHGYFVRGTHAHRQLVEVLQHFGPLPLEPFSRCLRCNAELREIAKASVESALQPMTRQHYDRFQTCFGCGQLYWQGSHWRRLADAVDAAIRETGGHAT
jgi:uncharacterized protein with PIN domain/sulfur carrier protein ThiS